MQTIFDTTAPVPPRDRPPVGDQAYLDLWIETARDAVTDYLTLPDPRGRGQADHVAAKWWLFFEQGPRSFEWLCELLGWNVDNVRAGLVARRVERLGSPPRRLKVVEGGHGSRNRSG